MRSYCFLFSKYLINDTVLNIDLNILKIKCIKNCELMHRKTRIHRETNYNFFKNK